MSIPRFYCPSVLFANRTTLGDSFELPPSAAHHASRVLRLRINDEVHLFDGAGNELHGRICEIPGKGMTAKNVFLDNLQCVAINRESPLHIVLAQALCSGDKMDWVVQKSTELGVKEIQAVQSERSTVRLSGDRAEKRAEHWRGITIAACEQCGRNSLPVVHSPQNLVDWLVAMRQFTATKFVLAPLDGGSLNQQVKPGGSIILLVGPEGGLSAAETKLSEQAGFIPIGFGPRILRTETAAITGIAAIQTLWGDMG